MPLDFEADLDIFLNADEFGTEAVIEGMTDPINVVFDTGEYTVDGHGGANITSSKPRMTGKTSEVASLAQGTKIEIKGLNYKLHKPGPDEDGFTTWELHKA